MVDTASNNSRGNMYGPLFACDYVPSSFNPLLMDEEAEKLATKYPEALRELGRLIWTHDVAQLVGVSVLHKHFTLCDNEILVERIDGCISTSSPAVRGTIEVIPHTWKVNDSGLWVPLEFISSHELTTARVTELNKKDIFLDELQKLIIKYGVQDIFGISVFHRDVIHAADTRGSIMETTDEKNRVLTVQPQSHMDPHSFQHSRISTTLWKFKQVPITRSSEVKQQEDVEVVAETGQGCRHCKHTCGRVSVLPVLSLMKNDVDVVAETGQGCCHCKHTYDHLPSIEQPKQEVEVVAETGQGCRHCKHTCGRVSVLPALSLMKNEVEVVAETGQGCCHCKHTYGQLALVEAF